MLDEDGKPIHLLILGDPGGVRALPYAKRELRRLVEVAQSMNALVMSRVLKVRVLPGAVTDVELEIHGDQRHITIKTQSCPDREGFLLVRDSDPEPDEYFAYYDDNTSEQINPLDGLPRPDPDPAKAKRTKKYVLPQQLRGSKLANTNSGKFSGLMRRAVACYHIGGKEAPFSYNHTKTHGITKLIWTSPEGDERSQYYIVEISASGVYMAPIKNPGCCAASFGIADYFDEETETVLDLAAGFAAEPPVPGIVRVLTAAEMVAPYTDPPFQIQQGWAFPVHGRECQQTTFHYAGLDGSNTFRTEWSRWKITFTADDQGVPSAVLTQEETDQVATFLNQSRPWSPHASDAQKWKQDFTLATNQNATAENFPVQDAPIHVYYDGDTEVVTRWHLLEQFNTFIPASVSGGPPAVYTPPSLSEQPTTMSAVYNTTVTTAARTVDRLVFGFYSTKTDGRVTTGGTGVLVESFWNVLGPTTVEVEARFGERAATTSPAGGELDLWYLIPTFANWTGIEQYDHIRNGNTTGESSIVMFIEDREACLHVYREIFVGTEGFSGYNTSWRRTGNRYGQYNTFLLEPEPAPGFRPFDIPAVYIYPTPQCAPNPFVFYTFPPTICGLWRPAESPVSSGGLGLVSGGTNVPFGFTFATFGTFPFPGGQIGGFNAPASDPPEDPPGGPPAATETRTATGFLGVGPVIATVGIDQGVIPTWVIPQNELMPFITTAPGPANFAESAVYALHGNLYYRRKGGGGAPPAIEAELSAEKDNVAYLLETDTTVTEDGFPAVDPADEVLAFVGQI